MVSFVSSLYIKRYPLKVTLNMLWIEFFHKNQGVRTYVGLWVYFDIFNFCTKIIILTIIWENNPNTLNFFFNRGSIILSILLLYRSILLLWMWYRYRIRTYIRWYIGSTWYWLRYVPYGTVLKNWFLKILWCYTAQPDMGVWFRMTRGISRAPSVV